MSLYSDSFNSSYVTACPGTESGSAGKVSACAGCPNQKICASGVAATPDPGMYVLDKLLNGPSNRELKLKFAAVITDLVKNDTFRGSIS